MWVRALWLVRSGSQGVLVEMQAGHCARIEVPFCAGLEKGKPGAPAGDPSAEAAAEHAAAMPR